MKTEAEKAKDLLRDHAVDLRRQIREAQLARTSPPTDRLEFIANAIEQVLCGKVPSLDRALGLTRGPGSPGSKGGNTGKHFDLAIEVMCRRAADQSWEDICEALIADEGKLLRQIYADADEREILRLHDSLAVDTKELRDICARERDAVMAWVANQAADQSEPERTFADIAAESHKAFLRRKGGD